MTTCAPCTILLVDDHAIVREGYRALLGKQNGLEVVAEAADGAQAYQRFKDFAPDLVIMDLSMPGQGGLTAISHIRQLDPAARILVFSMHENPLFALQAMHAGALGYVTKCSPADVLLQAIHEIQAGRRTLSSDIAQAIALERTAHETGALQSLTVREFEILRMLTEARSKEAIAQALNLSPKTVSNCHYLIKRKLGVNSDIELMHLAIRQKVISLVELSGPTLPS